MKIEHVLECFLKYVLTNFGKTLFNVYDIGRKIKEN
jgi:hypothetical protein